MWLLRTCPWCGSTFNSSAHRPGELASLCRDCVRKVGQSAQFEIELRDAEGDLRCSASEGGSPVQGR